MIGLMNEGRKIVVTDDDEEDFFLLKDAFDRLQLKHELLHLENGEDLLDYLSRINLKDKAFPHLILLDINMPRIDGFQALEKIKMSKDYSSIPIIMYSTSSSPLQKEKCATLGALDFVTKGSSFNDTLSFVKNIDVFLRNTSPQSEKRV